MGKGFPMGDASLALVYMAGLPQDTAQPSDIKVCPEEQICYPFNAKPEGEGERG